MQDMICTNCGEKEIKRNGFLSFNKFYCENCGAEYEKHSFSIELLLLVIFSLLISNSERLAEGFHFVFLIMLLVLPVFLSKFIPITRVYKENDPVIMTIGIVFLAAGLALNILVFDKFIYKYLALFGGGLLFMIIDHIDFKRRRTVEDKIARGGSTFV